MDFPQRHICEQQAWKRECLVNRWHSGRTRCPPACVCDRIGAPRTSRIPSRQLTLDAYCRQKGNHLSKPIPLDRFVDYGRWYQRQAVPDLDKRQIRSVETDARGFKVVMADGEEFTSRRVVVAGGISAFASRPAEFAGIPSALASHTSEHKDLGKFKGQRVVVIGAGQSALESAALFKEAGIQVEVIARTKTSELGRVACEIASSGRDFQNAVFEARRWSSRDQPSGCHAASVPSFPSSLPGSHCLPRDPARGRRLAATTNRRSTHHFGAQSGLRRCRGQPTSPST